MTRLKSNSKIGVQLGGSLWNPPPHPGVIIRRRFLDDLGQSQAEVVRKSGIDKTRLNRILTGRADINLDDSRSLARAFGMNALFFLDLQLKYDEAREKKPESFDAKLTLDDHAEDAKKDGE